MARTGRLFTAGDGEALLLQAKAWRRVCVGVLSRAPIHGPAYAATERVLSALDGLAEAVAGDREALHDAQHSVGGPSGGRDAERR